MQGFDCAEKAALCQRLSRPGLGSGFGYRFFIAQMVHDSAGTSQGKVSVSEGGRFLGTFAALQGGCKGMKRCSSHGVFGPDPNEEIIKNKTLLLYSSIVF